MPPHLPLVNPGGGNRAAVERSFVASHSVFQTWMIHVTQRNPPNSADSEVQQVTEKDGGQQELGAPTGPPGLRYFKGRRGCLCPEHAVVHSRLALALRNVLDRVASAPTTLPPGGNRREKHSQTRPGCPALGHLPRGDS